MRIKEGPPVGWVLEIAGLALAGMTQKGTWVEEPARQRPGGDFPSGPVVKNPPANAGDTGSISGPGTEGSHVKPWL